MMSIKEFRYFMLILDKEWATETQHEYKLTPEQFNSFSKKIKNIPDDVKPTTFTKNDIGLLKTGANPSRISDDKVSAILTFLTSNPNQEYTINEIAQNTSTGTTAATTGSKILWARGLVTRREIGYKYYYKAKPYEYKPNITNNAPIIVSDEQTQIASQLKKSAIDEREMNRQQ